MAKEENKKEVENKIVYDTDVSQHSDQDLELGVGQENQIKKLKEKIKKLETEKTDYMNGWQRERADFVNFKKRAEDEKKDYIKFANANLLEEMLAVLESFDMAFMNKEAWNSVPQNWRVGVEYIHSQLVKILDSNGLKEFVPKVGDKFDPKLHVADEMVAVTETDKEGLIISVKKKGYILNDKIIIAPKVVVGEVKK